MPISVWTFFDRLRRVALAVCVFSALLGTTLASREAHAQQLEPRAYSPSPSGMNFLGAAAIYTGGGVVTDPALPVENVTARIYTVAPFYARTFDLFGRLANVSAMVPVALVYAEGEVYEETRSTDRFGFLDPFARLAMNFIGVPALTPKEFRERRPETTLGGSLTVSAPLGQYDATKLVNIGTNRWGFRADIGFSQPVGPWIFELQSGTWFYTVNDNYRGEVLKQDPLTSLQTHIVYNFRPGLWLAGDFTCYGGGSTQIGDHSKDTRQANVRVGLTFAMPITAGQSVKLALGQGATTRIGGNFTSFALSYNLFWY